MATKRTLVVKGKKKGTGELQYYTGVYSRQHETRYHQGKPDICYDVAYRHDGRLIWEKVGWLSEGYSPELAEEIRNNRTRAVRHDEELPRDKQKAPLFKGIAQKYVEWAKENKKSGKDDESRYSHHLGPEFDAKRLDEISPLDIERFKSKAGKDGRVARADDKGRKATLEPGLSPQTIKHCLALLRQIFNKAMAWGEYQGPNPVKDVKLPTVKNGRERFLSYEEAEALLSELAATSPLTRDIALLSLHCGLRAGEIFALQAQNIDLARGIVRVTDPKNGESRASYMTDAVKAILKARIPDEPEAYIFVDTRHKGRIAQVSQAFTKAVARLGFNRGVSDRRQKVTFHTLRHTHASWLALQGESLLTIAEALGHKTLVMVRRYAHLIPDEKRKAALRLEEAFNRSRDDAKEAN
jgi:integrase